MATAAKLDIAERESNTLEALYNTNTAYIRTREAKITKSYFSDPDVQNFHNDIRTNGFKKMRKSREVKFGTVDEVFREIKDYFDLCAAHGQFPSKISLCTYLGICTRTFDNYRNDINSEYSDLFTFALQCIHEIIESGALANKINPATYIFTATNFYGMRDARNLDVSSVSANFNFQPTAESVKALREQLQSEGSGKESKKSFIDSLDDDCVEAPFEEK